MQTNNYTFFTDNANIQNIGGGTITQANLCVTGDTKILTKAYGYVPIKDVAGQMLDCWNGEEWSKTPLFKTSDSEPVLTVQLKDGTVIKATPYHKWYVNNTYSKTPQMKRTHELLPGDKLTKFDLSPVDHGTNVLEYAYESGFITGDGAVLERGAAKIVFYSDQKKGLIPNFNGYASITETKSSNTGSDTRLNMTYDSDTYSTMYPKCLVPDSSYCVSSRLDWLAGLFDSDGCLLTAPTGAKSVQLSSTNLEMLHNIKLMLQELGVQSNVSSRQPAGYSLLPDGKGGSKEYWCNATYLISISHGGLAQLTDLGYVGHRIQLPSTEQQRNAVRYQQIESVTDHGEAAAVYCGREFKRNKLMFNGVLTGNCMEYLPNFDAISHISDDLVTSQNVGTYMERRYTGDVALCNLASVNLAHWVTKSPLEKRAFMLLLVTSMDNAIDNSFYSNELGRVHSFAHRNLGIGVSNYALILASHGLRWDDAEAQKLTHRIFEELSFYAISASIDLAKQRGRYPLFDKSKWAQGIFPHELSILHNSKSELNTPLLMDWGSLRSDLLKYGIRNEYLLAIAPTATSGLCINATPGVDVPRKLKTIQEGTYSLPFVAPQLQKCREFYQTTFEVSNKDTIRLAAIRQKFVCMSQSVSLAYATPNSAHDVIDDIMYAEELGLKSLYYTFTPTADDLSDDGCDSCGS